MTVNVICLIITLVAVAFAARCYRELWKWARQCQHARIAIAYKRKVVMQAPLLEWLLWCNQLDADKDSDGRTVFGRAGVTVAIVKAVQPPGRVRKAIRSVKAKRGSGAPARQGVKA